MSKSRFSRRPPIKKGAFVRKKIKIRMADGEKGGVKMGEKKECFDFYRPHMQTDLKQTKKIKSNKLCKLLRLYSSDVAVFFNVLNRDRAKNRGGKVRKKEKK